MAVDLIPGTSVLGWWDGMSNAWDVGCVPGLEDGDGELGGPSRVLECSAGPQRLGGDCDIQVWMGHMRL